MGYAAETFSSAEEYLRSNRAADTACLISDIQMPGMNGADLQDRLLADGHRTPIIFVTAFPDENIRARVLKAGALWFPDQAVQRRKPDRVPGQGAARRQERSSLVIAAPG